jgi:hypothetical protein
VLERYEWSLAQLQLVIGNTVKAGEMDARESVCELVESVTVSRGTPGLPKRRSSTG